MPITTPSPARLRSAFADACAAVKKPIDAADREAITDALDAARWPFECAAWKVEQGLIWPLQGRFGRPQPSRRSLGLGLLCLAGTLLATGLIVLAPWEGAAPAPPTAAPSGAPIAAKAAAGGPSLLRSGHVLHGVAPFFGRPAGHPAAKIANEKTVRTPSAGAAGGRENDAASISSAPAIIGKPAPAAALRVAHRFSDAFVLYETGRASAAVRADFASTATPELARSLLRRPPRQPAAVRVPTARVLNVIPGPSSGSVYTVSVSLLRVGLTSELRLEMEKTKQGAWQVTDVLG